MDLHLIAAAWNWLNLETWVSVALIILGLGLVIFVHELGHFVIAKLCGVKCDKFYIGFDVPIKLHVGRLRIQLPATLWKRRWGETEYGVGIIPLGGYVKMLGQDDNPSRAKEAAEASRLQGDRENAGVAPLNPRSYPAKTVPQRMAITSAGVVMNVIFAYLFALTAILIGIPYVPCVVGYTLPGEPAWQYDIRPRDRIVEINGVRNPRFDDFQQQVLLADPRHGVRLVIERPGPSNSFQTIIKTLRPDSAPSEKRLVPRLGVRMLSALTLDSEKPTQPNSSAAGLPPGKDFRGGDRIVNIDGEPLVDSVSYQSILARDPSKSLKMTIERRAADNPGSDRITIEIPPSPWRHLGVTMAMGAVTAVRQDSPAASATSPHCEGGLRPGDRIVRIDGQAAGDPLTLPMRLAQLHGRPVRIEVERPTSHGTADQLEFTATPVQPTTFIDSPYEDDAVAVPSLGVTYTVSPRVLAVDPAGPAARKGIQVGDQIVAATFVPQVNPQTKAETLASNEDRLLAPFDFGLPGRGWPALVTSLQSLGPQTRVRLTVKSDLGTRQVDVQPIASKEFFNPDRGLRFKPNEQKLMVHGVSDAAEFAWRETQRSLLAVYIFIHKVCAGELSPKLFGGPLTIFVVAWMSARAGVGKLLLFLTLLSANLAVVNFLPIPVLDGGHMVFLSLEGICRRPLSQKIVLPLTYAGLILILSLTIFVTVLDVNRFLWPF